MTPQEFEQHIKGLAIQSEAFINNELRRSVGKIAVDHFTENFQQEGFVDDSLEKWPEVKRRLNPRTRGARKTRKILTGETGDLGRSINYDLGPGSDSITIYSDKPYAAAHNEGTTTAGRGNSTTIPKRPFIGHSDKLDGKIRKEIEDGLDRVLHK